MDRIKIEENNEQMKEMLRELNKNFLTVFIGVGGTGSRIVEKLYDMANNSTQYHSMINKVLFSDDDLTIKPIPGNYNIQFYFTFITEHTANTDIPYADHAAGSIEIENASSDKAIISVYDLIDPSFIWGNISVEYEQ